jgi:hypothetical protein
VVVIGLIHQQRAHEIRQSRRTVRHLRHLARGVRPAIGALCELSVIHRFREFCCGAAEGWVDSNTCSNILVSGPTVCRSTMSAWSI